LIVQRENNRMASEAILLRAAAASIMSEEAGKHFDEMIERLREE
jgi:hypothetical protein